MKLISHEKMMETLDWVYEKSVDGLPGLGSAEELAQTYMKSGGTPFEQANSLIKWQKAKAGTSGFVTGLGGLMALPVTLPMNITSVLYVQIRMIAAIAHMGGYDLRDDRVKSLVYMCLIANTGKEVLKDVGIGVGSKLALNAVKQIPGKTLTQINQKVGFRLLTKFGEKGVINLGKAIPLIGGLIGGSVDYIATNSIGKVARDTFTPLTPNGDQISFAANDAGLQTIANESIDAPSQVATNPRR
jgi:hypothetical protein